MKLRILWIAALACGLLTAGASAVRAAGRAELELVGSGPGAALAFQQWLRAFSGAGIEHVRFRSSRATDQVGVEVRGTEESPVYVVTGEVVSANELRLPVGRFAPRDLGRLKAWLDDLARHGPGGKPREQSAFGLPAAQYATIREDLSQPVTFSTAGVSRRDVVQRIGRGLLTPLQLDPGAAEALAGDQVAEELTGLSAGTALAYVLRPMGYCLVPRSAGGGAICVVTRARPELDIWPVGWEPDKPRNELLPALFEFRNVNVQGVTAEVTIRAIAKRLGVPALVDHNALARHGVEPAKAVVSHPQSRTTYGLALRKLLFQAQLKYEIRVDEAGQPFLWITTIKPV
jgi:hypothetical protein